MGFASPFPDVDVADVSVFGLLFTDIDQTDWPGSRSSMPPVAPR